MAKQVYCLPNLGIIISPSRLPSSRFITYQFDFPSPGRFLVNGIQGFGVSIQCKT